RMRASLNALAFAANVRSRRSGILTSSIHGWFAAHFATIASVASVDPSETITHLTGRSVCATTDWIVSSMYSASFRAAVTRTYGTASSRSRAVTGTLIDVLSARRVRARSTK